MTDRALIARALGRYMTCDVANLAANDILAALADAGLVIMPVEPKEAEKRRKILRGHMSGD